LRVTALVLKAVQLFKKFRSISDNSVIEDQVLTVDNLCDAEVYWCQEVQRDCFPENWYSLQQGKEFLKNSPLTSLSPVFDETIKLIWVGGRSQFSDLPEETKHQIILPAKHPVVDKLIAFYHEERGCHAGPETTLGILRERFWIIHGRCTVQKVIR
jgi:hypothetical protein